MIPPTHTALRLAMPTAATASASEAAAPHAGGARAAKRARAHESQPSVKARRVSGSSPHQDECWGDVRLQLLDDACQRSVADDVNASLRVLQLRPRALAAVEHAHRAAPGTARSLSRRSSGRDDDGGRGAFGCHTGAGAGAGAGVGAGDTGDAGDTIAGDREGHATGGRSEPSTCLVAAFARHGARLRLRLRRRMGLAPAAQQPPALASAAPGRVPSPKALAQRFAQWHAVARLARGGARAQVVRLDGDGTPQRGHGPVRLASAGAESVLGNLVEYRACDDRRAEGVVAVMGEDFVVPAPCAFFCGDVFRWGGLVRSGCPHRFHLTVIDPPWPNKSVARAKLYSTMTYRRLATLARLPLSPALVAGAVVAVWVTHDPAALELVKETLFPAWGVTYATKWYWLKVAASDGAPVFPIPASNAGRPCSCSVCCEGGDAAQHVPVPRGRNTGRKPWEVLVIGVRGEQHAARFPTTPRAFAAPPTVHSVKPPVDGLLAPWLPSLDTPAPSKLELFARRLRAGWVGVGDQCLLFQARDLFVTPSPQPPSASVAELSSSDHREVPQIQK